MQATAIETALNALNVGGNSTDDFTVAEGASDGLFTITFGGDVANRNVQLLKINSNQLTGVSPRIVTTQEGVSESTLTRTVTWDRAAAGNYDSSNPDPVTISQVTRGSSTPAQLGQRGYDTWNWSVVAAQPPFLGPPPLAGQATLALCWTTTP